MSSESKKEESELDDVIELDSLKSEILKIMKIPPSILVLFAVLLSVISAGAMLWLIMTTYYFKPQIKAEFTSLEFDADDTSYSPAETHSMNQLSKELAALKERLLEREKELDARESAIVMDMESRNQKKNLEIGRIFPKVSGL